MWEKIIGFFTGGLPTEIAKQVGDNIKAKGENAVQTFLAEIAFDLELVKTGTADPWHTRQGIAWSFHLFMWGTRVITGNFPTDVILQWGDHAISIGFVYVLIIMFYFPVRALEKLKKAF